MNWSQHCTDFKISRLQNYKSILKYMRPILWKTACSDIDHSEKPWFKLCNCINCVLLESFSQLHSIKEVGRSIDQARISLFTKSKQQQEQECTLISASIECSCVGSVASRDKTDSSFQQTYSRAVHYRFKVMGHWSGGHRLRVLGHQTLLAKLESLVSCNL